MRLTDFLYCRALRRYQFGKYHHSPRYLLKKPPKILDAAVSRRRHEP